MNMDTTQTKNLILKRMTRGLKWENIVTRLKRSILTDDEWRVPVYGITYMCLSCLQRRMRHQRWGQKNEWTPVPH